MLSSDEDRNLYILERLLAELPGKPEEINQDLSVLLIDPNAKVAAERASHIKHLRYYLQDEKISELTRHAIEAKITAFTNPPIACLPAETSLFIFSFFSPRKRLQLASVSKTWHEFAQDRYYWLNILTQEAGVAREEINDLVEPRQVYQRFKNIQMLFSNTLSYVNYSFPFVPSRSCLLHALDSTNGIEKFFTSTDRLMRPFDLSLAALTGHQPLVKHLVNTFHLIPNVDHLNVAALSGSLSLVKYLIEEHGLKPDKGTLDNAAYSGNVSLVQYLIEKQKIKPEIENFDKALFSGNLALFQYLVEIMYKFELDQDRLNNAISSGSLSLVKGLLALISVKNKLTKYQLKLDADQLHRAALSGSLSLVKYLIAQYHLTPNMHTLDAAVRSGSLPLIQYLIEKHHLKIEKHCIKAGAAFAGVPNPNIFSVLRYLIETYNLVPDMATLQFAAKVGCLASLKYMIETRNLKPDTTVLNSAASGHNLILVKYLIETFGLKPDENTLQYATVSGDLPIIQYLVEIHHLKPDSISLASNKIYPDYIKNYFEHILEIPQRMPRVS